jgi:hypothetical protein
MQEQFLGTDAFYYKKREAGFDQLFIWCRVVSLQGNVNRRTLYN